MGKTPNIVIPPARTPSAHRSCAFANRSWADNSICPLQTLHEATDAATQMPSLVTAFEIARPGRQLARSHGWSCERRPNLDRRSQEGVKQSGARAFFTLVFSPLALGFYSSWSLPGKNSMLSARTSLPKSHFSTLRLSEVAVAANRRSRLEPGSDFAQVRSLVWVGEQAWVWPR